MRPVFIFAAAFLTVLSTSSVDASATNSAVLPPGAHITASVPIPQRSKVLAVSYATNHAYVGVVRKSAAAETLIWSVRLPFGLSRIAAPGPGGVFIGMGSSGHRGEIVAFRLHNHSIQSAVSGLQSGVLVAQEGTRLQRNGFTARDRDSSHTGSIPYLKVRHFTWDGRVFALTKTTRRPNLSSSSLTGPHDVIKTTNGDTFFQRLQVAATATQRDQGLMNVHQLDPDTGMIFVWPTEVHDSFWMENTYIPLSVAFLAADGTIQEIQDMAPLTLDYHTPVQPYLYAVEVDQGHFSTNGIGPGDRLQLSLGSVVSQPDP